MDKQLIQKIKPDKYLKKFINEYKLKYGDELIAIVIYGSYAFGYFDENKSDYDVFMIFKNKVPKIEGVMPKEHPKIFFQYFCNTQYLLDKVKEGRWSVYITLLKSAKVLYYTKDYVKFLERIDKINPSKKLIKKLTREKIKKEKKGFRENRGYKAVKWIFPSIRKRLQILVYLKIGKRILGDRKSCEVK